MLVLQIVVKEDTKQAFKKSKRGFQFPALPQRNCHKKIKKLKEKSFEKVHFPPQELSCNHATVPILSPLTSLLSMKPIQPCQQSSFFMLPHRLGKRSSVSGHHRSLQSRMTSDSGWGHISCLANIYIYTMCVCPRPGLLQSQQLGGAGAQGTLSQPHPP